MLRTSLSAEQADAATTVRCYKSLAQVERVFRCTKTVDLELQPVFHWTAPRVRGHVLLCMLAYYLEWHLRQPLAPMLFDDHDRARDEAQRVSPVAKAKISKPARRKASTQRIGLADGTTQPVHSLQTLLADLATLTRNTVCFAEEKMLTVQTTPTPYSVGRSSGHIPQVRAAFCNTTRTIIRRLGFRLRTQLIHHLRIMASMVVAR